MLFANYFLDEANKELEKNIEGFSEEVQTIFSNYSWPGNLRELKNIVKRSTLLAKSDFIDVPDLPEDQWDRLYQSYGSCRTAEELLARAWGAEVAGWDRNDTPYLEHLDPAYLRYYYASKLGPRVEEETSLMTALIRCEWS